VSRGKYTAALDVACPSCGAAAGEMCSLRIELPHRTRSAVAAGVTRDANRRAREASS
jgi:hypothetical protein